MTGAFESCIQKAQVERHVVCHEDVFAQKIQKLRQHLFRWRTIYYHARRNTRDFRDTRGDRATRVYERGKAVGDGSFLQTNRPNLQQAIAAGFGAGRLGINDHKRSIVQRHVAEGRCVN